MAGWGIYLREKVQKAGANEAITYKTGTGHSRGMVFNMFMRESIIARGLFLGNFRFKPEVDGLGAEMPLFLLRPSECGSIERSTTIFGQLPVLTEIGHNSLNLF